MNAKAAIYAVLSVQEDQGEDIHTDALGTITDASGRTLSGQTPEAFLEFNRACKTSLIVGLNCALGASDLRPHIQALSRVADTFVSLHPNAGLPNEFGEYDESPADMVETIGEFVDSGFVNVVGGAVEPHRRMCKRSPILCRMPRPGRCPSTHTMPFERLRAALC